MIARFCQKRSATDRTRSCVLKTIVQPFLQTHPDVHVFQHDYATLRLCVTIQFLNDNNINVMGWPSRPFPYWTFVGWTWWPNLFKVQSKDVTGNWKRAISWMAEHSSTNKIMVQSMGKMCCMHQWQWRAYSLLTLQFWFWSSVTCIGSLENLIESAMP